MASLQLRSVANKLVARIAVVFLTALFAVADEPLTPSVRVPVNGKQIAGALSGGERREKWNPKSNEEDLQGDAERIYEKVAPAVVVVRTAQGHGTGFLISSDGWIVTNHHVVNDAITVINDGPVSGSQIARINLGKSVDGEMKVDESQIPAFIFKLDEQKDLALLKLVELPQGVMELPHLKLAEKKPGPGSSCVAIGHPKSGMLWTLRKGEISSLGTWPKDRIDVMLEYLSDSPDQRKEMQQTLANIPGRRVVISTCGVNPGDSGGPLVNSNGDVIAVTFAIPKNLSGDGISLDKFSYHVLAEELKEFLREIPDKPPLHVPEFWPEAIGGRIMDRDEDGQNDTMTFLAGEDVVSGLLVDADQNSGASFAREINDGKKGRDAWDAEIMVHPLSGKVFYDKDNDGEFDEIVRDFDGDGVAELVLRRTNGAWSVRQVEKQPSFDFTLFADKSIANRVKKILGGKGRKDVSQPVASEADKKSK